jgi:hypothetical protein
MRGFDAGGDCARGDRVGFVGEGRVSPPASGDLLPLPTTRSARGLIHSRGVKPTPIVKPAKTRRHGRANPACPERSRRALPYSRKRQRSESAALIFVSVRKKSALYFLQLTESLIEPLFRLDSAVVLANGKEVS